jgi:hypothetical protein
MVPSLFHLDPHPHRLGTSGDLRSEAAMAMDIIELQFVQFPWGGRGGSGSSWQERVVRTGAGQRDAAPREGYRWRECVGVASSSQMGRPIFPTLSVCWWEAFS